MVVPADMGHVIYMRAYARGGLMSVFSTFSPRPRRRTVSMDPERLDEILSAVWREALDQARAEVGSGGGRGAVAGTSESAERTVEGKSEADWTAVRDARQRLWDAYDQYDPNDPTTWDAVRQSRAEVERLWS